MPLIHILNINSVFEYEQYQFCLASLPSYISITFKKLLKLCVMIHYLEALIYLFILLLLLFFLIKDIYIFSIKISLYIILYIKKNKMTNVLL